MCVTCGNHDFSLKTDDKPLLNNPPPIPPHFTSVVRSAAPDSQGMYIVEERPGVFERWPGGR